MSKPIDTTHSNKLARKASSQTGKVYLVAAGPGQPDYLTLRAAEVLASCDIILYDALANIELLKHAAPTAKCISVGKHGTDRLWQQTEIMAELLQHARAGRQVARLKGGDTSIFARTGEELEFLLAENIEFEVVPGVTSASAASACTGIPLTHRDWASCVAYVTGHQQSTDGAEEAEDDLDWNALAKFPGTLILYMAVTTAHRWSNALIQSGKPSNTPVAIIRNASLPNQQVIRTSLGELASVVAGPPKLRPPILFIVGQVANASAQLDWFGRRPLVGKMILLTRPAGQNESIAQALRSLGADALIHPAIDLCPPPEKSPHAIELLESIEHAGQYEWIVFSSANGVRFWMERFFETHRDARALGSAKIAGVGPSVAAALSEYRLSCELVLDAEGDSEKLAERMKLLVQDKSVLNVTTNHSREILQQELSPHAKRVQSVVAYESHTNFALPDHVKRQLQSTQPFYVTATSTRIVQAAWQQLGELAANAIWLANSIRAADQLKSLGAFDVRLLPELTAEAIVEAMIDERNESHGSL